jgi:hypothetical protein
MWRKLTDAQSAIIAAVITGIFVCIAAAVGLGYPILEEWAEIQFAPTTFSPQTSDDNGLTAVATDETEERSSSMKVETTELEYGELLYEENFEQDTGAWSFKYGSSITNGELIIASRTDAGPRTAGQYSDFVFETEFRYLDTEAKNGNSFYLRHNPCPGWNCSIQISIDADLKTVIARRMNGEKPAEDLIPPIFIENLTVNEPLKLTVVAEDDSFKLFLNGTFIGVFSDTTYHSGGIIMDNGGTGPVAIDYLRIYDLP